MQRNLVNAHTPVWGNKEKTRIDLTVEFKEFPGEPMPFSASPYDSEEHGRDIFSRAFAGEFGVVADYVEPPIRIPAVVTMRQARLALFDFGLLNKVSAAIASLPSPHKEIAQIEWEYSQAVERDRPWVAQLAASIGLNEEQLDNLFLVASKK
jgi:hypothetical protein